MFDRQSMAHKYFPKIDTFALVINTLKDAEI